MIPSPKVATYDLKPEMSAPEVAAECVKRIESGKYDVVILNFANCDMVGHTGVFDAAVKAVEAVDTAVDQVVSAVLRPAAAPSSPPTTATREDDEPGRYPLHRTHHQRGALCGCWLRRCEAA